MCVCVCVRVRKCVALFFVVVANLLTFSATIFPHQIPKDDTVTYLIKAGLSEKASASSSSSSSSAARCPMVVFCVDISGSMSTTTAVPGGIELYQLGRRDHVSRLDCIKAAIHAQLQEMQKSDPACVPVIILFGSSVTVIADNARSLPVESRIENDTEALIQKGRSFRGKCTHTVTRAYTVKNDMVVMLLLFYYYYCFFFC